MISTRREQMTVLIVLSPEKVFHTALCFSPEGIPRKLLNSDSTHMLKLKLQGLTQKELKSTSQNT